MNTTLKRGLILSLVIIVALQIAYVFQESWRQIQLSSETMILIISFVFAVVFILALILVYKKSKIDEQRKRFTNHNLMSNRQYEIMRLKNTNIELQKLKNSEQFKLWAASGKDKQGYSNSKTNSTFKDQNTEDFMKLWGSLQSQYFETTE